MTCFFWLCLYFQCVVCGLLLLLILEVVPFKCCNRFARDDVSNGSPFDSQVFVFYSTLYAEFLLNVVTVLHMMMFLMALPLILSSLYFTQFYMMSCWFFTGLYVT